MAVAPQGPSRGPREVALAELWTGADGTPVTFACPAGGSPIHVQTGIAQKLMAKASGDLRRQDRSAAIDAAVVTRFIGETLADARYRTNVGALTPVGSGHDPSVDYLCRGPRVLQWWPTTAPGPSRPAEWVTVVVRRVPPEPAAASVFLCDDAGLVALLITMTPKSRRKWGPVIDGAPVAAATQTLLLRPGDRFDPAEHTDWCATR